MPSNVPPACPVILALIAFAPSGEAQMPKLLLESTPLAPASSGDGETLFERLPPAQTGLQHVYELVEDHELRHLYTTGFFTGAPCIGDLDGDGRVDVFLAGTTSANRLYLQTGDLQFVDQAEAAGVADPGVWSAGASLMDLDNDGDLDIYVPVYNAGNRLFINESNPGELRFKEMAAGYGINGVEASLNSAFADTDRDGDLDLYVQNYQLERPTGRPEGKMPIEILEGKVGGHQARIPIVGEEFQPFYSAFFQDQNTVSWEETGRPDYLMRNNGKGLPFSDITTAIGLNPGRSYGTSMVFWDVDHNLWPDLFIGNDLEDADQLYYNGGTKGVVRSTSAMLPVTAWMTRGSAAADFNGDLLVDLITTDTLPLDPALDVAHEDTRQNYGKLRLVGEIPQVMRNTLFLNTGTVRITESARLSGVERTGNTWSVKAEDFDLDGAVDLFFANGTPRDPLAKRRSDLEGEALIGKTRWDLLADSPENPENDQVYRNDGSGKFESFNAPWGVGTTASISGGSAVGDLDGDGDLDLVVCRLGEPLAVYRNHATGNRLVIELRGQGSNWNGIGSTVYLELPDGRKMMRQLNPTNGFLGSDEPVISFGLGDAPEAKVTVLWPSGAVQTYPSIAAGMRHRILEATTLVDPVDRGGLAAGEAPIFASSDALGAILMEERDYPDNDLQALLPNELSHAGPALAWGDADGDERYEAYLGAPAIYPGRLISQSPRLAEREQGFGEHSLTEDGGAIFFDADGDGDQDLYVTSGGIEVETGNVGFRDRLYLNDGTGDYAIDETLTSSELRESTGAVAAADFDRDGDVDVFVGARVRVGEYPKGGQSVLLVNDGTGKLTDAAPAELAQSGMVTGALWSDADGDGTLDLLTTSEWGTIRLWKNREGTLVDETLSGGLAGLVGRWNGITGRDIDNDGDMDYLVTNIGRNTPYGSGEAEISDLFYGDFGAKDGAPLIIETTTRGGKRYPRAVYAAMARYVEGFSESYPDARAYGSATIEDVFGGSAVEAAMHRKLTETSTGILINDGNGRFTFQPLPDAAQLAPGFGCLLTDVNFDGLADAIVVQNMVETPIDFGPFNGGIGAVMLGTGDPTRPFEAMLGVKSGIVIHGPARALAANDLDNDSKVDLTVTINGSAPATFFNQASTETFRPVAVRLDRSPGKSPIGARVTVRAAGLPPQTAEYYAGDGYLSQSAPILFFGAMADDDSAVVVEIRWSDGTTNRRKIYR